MSVYLDYNATAPLRASAHAAMVDALALANPSSVHAAGRAARAGVEKARAAIADAVGTKPAQVIFTSGATEANALALAGLKAKKILVSATEHDSILANAAGAQIIPVHSNGLINLEALENLLQAQDAPALVCVMAVNNESGVIQPIADISKLTKQYNALLHIDAVQALGRIPVSMSEWGADSVSLSAHKMGGPKGIGALIVRDGLPVAPLIKGGGQEQNRRAGTENVPAIAGFGAVAAEIAALLDDQKRLQSLQKNLEEKLSSITGVTIYGQSAPRVSNTTLLTLRGVSSATQLMNLDMDGFCVSSGSACSSGKVKPSHVLTAMGVPPDEAATALRISTGWETKESDIDAFAKAFEAMAKRLLT